MKGQITRTSYYFFAEQSAKGGMPIIFSRFSHIRSMTFIKDVPGDCEEASTE